MRCLPCLVLIGLLLVESFFSASLPPAYPFFLKSAYKVKDDHKTAFHVRQVPGDGSCLFHAISVWVSYFQTNSHTKFDWKLRELSGKLRNLSIEILKSNETLLMENGESIAAEDLLAMVSEHYNMTGEEYCQQMYDSKTWGGGPEIVALSNHFKCPIHVYQLRKGGFITNPCFRLELCAKFGSPAFDSKYLIQILCADGR